jgi:hypothetical protein
MDTTRSSNNGRKEIAVAPEEGQRIIMRAMLATLDETGDVAAERTWQAHAVLVLKHTQRFMQELGMVQVLKMQQMCADMVLKIRLAGKKTGDDGSGDVLAEYEQMLEEIFTQRPLEAEDDAEEGEGADAGEARG